MSFEYLEGQVLFYFFKKATVYLEFKVFVIPDYNGRRGYKDLAVELLDGQLAYPSLVLMDSELNKIQVIRGFKTADQLMAILKSGSPKI